MIKITKKECDYLNKECGVRFGENGISRTYGHTHTYYLCESERNKKLLRRYYEKIGQDPSVVR